MTKADILSGRPVGKGRQDRQFVDNIAQCMSDAENRPDKDEEWMTWWRETLLAVQGGLQKGWIDADSPVRNGLIHELFQGLQFLTLYIHVLSPHLLENPFRTLYTRGTL
jgi:hypothetical protein